MAAPIGNKYAQEWTLENALPRFEDALIFAQNEDDCLCFQDAVFHSGIPRTTFYKLAENHEVLNIIKEDIMDAVIRRVNKNALKNNFAAAPAIWRMKQLGERDEQHINQNIASKTDIFVTDADTKKSIEDLKTKFDSES